MKTWSIISLAAMVAISGCTPIHGSLCDAPLPVVLNENAARSLVKEDRAAAVQISTLNGLYERACL